MWKLLDSFQRKIVFTFHITNFSNVEFTTDKVKFDFVHINLVPRSKIENHSIPNYLSDACGFPNFPCNNASIFTFSQMTYWCCRLLQMRGFKLWGKTWFQQIQSNTKYINKSLSSLNFFGLVCVWSKWKKNFRFLSFTKNEMKCEICFDVYRLVA